MIHQDQARIEEKIIKKETWTIFTNF